MKKMKVVMTMGIFLFLTIFKTNAQPAKGVQVKTIEPYRLEVAYSKTTNIVFPHAIISVDRGSKDILAQKAKGVENILQVKAAKESFTETNLSVVTADGRLNSFILNYANEPTVLNFALSGNSLQSGPLYFSPENNNEAELKSYSIAAATSRHEIGGINDNNYGIRFQLNGLFIRDNMLYFRISLENQSNINYAIEQFRFFIKDQKKSKRTAAQEIELLPLYILNGISEIKSNSDHSLVLAIPKFTIPDRKVLTIQLMEKSGGRNLELRVKNKVVIAAKPL
jgi:conjugative transposon TraN protein